MALLLPKTDDDLMDKEWLLLGENKSILHDEIEIETIDKDLVAAWAFYIRGPAVLLDEQYFTLDVNGVKREYHDSQQALDERRGLLCLLTAPWTFGCGTDPALGVYGSLGPLGRKLHEDTRREVSGRQIAVTGNIGIPRFRVPVKDFDLEFFLAQQRQRQEADAKLMPKRQKKEEKAWERDAEQAIEDMMRREFLEYGWEYDIWAQSHANPYRNFEPFKNFAEFMHDMHGVTYSYMAPSSEKRQWCFFDFLVAHLKVYFCCRVALWNVNLFALLSVTLRTGFRYSLGKTPGETCVYGGVVTRFGNGEEELKYNRRV